MLKKLFEGAESTPVQRTRLSIDVLGRFICSTLDEALASGPFDLIVIGSGMYGGFVAQEAKQKGLRVLVLEAGPFLVSEHVQNLAMIGLDVPSEIPPSHDPGVPRNQVWGIPWRGNQSFPGLAFCVGGKSLYWGGWCPRLTPGDLALWPSDVATALPGLYDTLEKQTGVVPGVDFIQGPLQDVLKSRFESAALFAANVELGLGTNGVSEAPLAVQAAPPVSGLFSFDKFSSTPVLAHVIRQDVSASNGSDAARRLMLVPNARVLRIDSNGGTAQSLEVVENGVRRTISLAPGGRVVLACSTIETTRLALESFPSPLMGRNLMVHLRSDLTVRIKRSALGALPTHLQTSALLVRGLSGQRRFHIQVVAVASQSQNPEESLFRMVPDIDTLDAIVASLDSEWVTVVLRSVGEMVGDRTSPVPRPGGSWMNLSPYEYDEFGFRRAWVQLNTDSHDHALWTAMEQTSLDLAAAVAGVPSNIHYAHSGGWQNTPPALSGFAPWRRGLGTTYHETGTLWMGDDPSTSVTDVFGRLHHMTNVYACDQSIFPTVASVNPVLTGLCLAHRLAAHL